MKNLRTKLAISMAVVLGLAANVQAIQIKGDLSLAGGLGINSGSLNTASALTFSGVSVTGASGDYAGLVTLNTAGSILMNGFTFKPNLNPSPVSPLWRTDTALFPGQAAASFDLEEITLVQQSIPGFLLIQGAGTLYLDGFDPTPGVWRFSSQAGQGTFSFSASNFSQVPDGGTTAMLLGGALAGLAFLRRKLA